MAIRYSIKQQKYHLFWEGLSMIQDINFDALMGLEGEDLKKLDIGKQDPGDVFLLQDSWGRTYFFEVSDPARRMVNIFPFKPDGNAHQCIQKLEGCHEIKEAIELGKSVSFGSNWYTGILRVLKKLKLE
jgi:hypothetical protein